MDIRALCVCDDEKSLSTLFRVQYFFLVFSFASLSFLLLFSPCCSIQESLACRCTFPTLYSLNAKKDGTIGPARTSNPARTTLSPTAFKIEIIHHQRVFLDIFFFPFSFLVYRLFKHASYFYTFGRRTFGNTQNRHSPPPPNVRGGLPPNARLMTRTIYFNFFFF